MTPPPPPAPPPHQMLLGSLDGHTLCLQFATAVITGADVVAQLARQHHPGIPPLPLMRLVTGTSVITSDSLLTASSDADGLFPSCRVLLRLRGGKGGFGSLLRGAATKAGQKKTSNFDACRDMSGRRLRHVNAEKKLKEWKADAEERELERTAEEFLKKDKKAKEENSGVYQELQLFRAETSRGMEQVDLAVASGLAEARKLDANGKRKLIEDTGILAKRLCVWMDEEYTDDDEDIDDDVDDDEGGPSIGGGAGDAAGGAEDEDVATPEQGEEVAILPSTFLGARSSVSGSSSGNEGSPPLLSTEAGKGSLGGGTITATLRTECVIEEVSSLSQEVLSANRVATMECVIEEVSSLSQEVLSADRITTTECVIEEVSSLSQEVINTNEITTECVIEEVSSHSQEVVSTNTIARSEKAKAAAATVEEGPVDFNHYQSSEAMEGLGLEKLKVELQARGLKCGGSLSERAGRLFLLKTIPLDKLDKKHFAAKQLVECNRMKPSIIV